MICQIDWRPRRVVQTVYFGPADKPPGRVHAAEKDSRTLAHYNGNVSEGDWDVAGREPTWIGPHYETGGALAKRLLILGPPRASGAGDLRQVGRAFEALFTPEYISGEMKHVLWTTVARLVLGRPAERLECEDLWRSVAFSNLEPERAGPLLARLEPEALLLLGWPLPEESRSLLENAVRPGAAIPKLLSLPHPASRDFAFRDWTDDVRRLMRAD